MRAARFVGGTSALFAALAVLNATSAVLLPQQRVPFAAAAVAHVLLVAYDQENRLLKRSIRRVVAAHAQTLTEYFRLRDNTKSGDRS